MKEIIKINKYKLVLFHFFLVFIVLFCKTDVPTVESETGCVEKGTFVSTPVNAIQVQNLKIGDIIFSYAIEKKEIVKRKILNIKPHERNNLYRIFLQNMFLNVTGEHPIFVNKLQNYVNSSELKISEELLVFDKNTIETASINEIDMIVNETMPYNVYDITTEGPEHNFFANGILVHNKTDPNSIAHKCSNDNVVEKACAYYGAPGTSNTYECRAYTGSLWIDETILADCTETNISGSSVEVCNHGCPLNDQNQHINGSCTINIGEENEYIIYYGSGQAIYLEGYCQETLDGIWTDLVQK